MKYVTKLVSLLMVVVLMFTLAPAMTVHAADEVLTDYVAKFMSKNSITLELQPGDIVTVGSTKGVTSACKKITKVKIKNVQGDTDAITVSVDKSKKFFVLSANETVTKDTTAKVVVKTKNNKTFKFKVVVTQSAPLVKTRETISVDATGVTMAASWVTESYTDANGDQIDFIKGIVDGVEYTDIEAFFDAVNPKGYIELVKDGLGSANIEGVVATATKNGLAAHTVYTYDGRIMYVKVKGYDGITDVLAPYNKNDFVVPALVGTNPQVVIVPSDTSYAGRVYLVDSGDGIFEGNYLRKLTAAIVEYGTSKNYGTYNEDYTLDDILYEANIYIGSDGSAIVIPIN